MPKGASVCSWNKWTDWEKKKSEKTQTLFILELIHNINVLTKIKLDQISK